MAVDLNKAPTGWSPTKKLAMMCGSIVLGGALVTVACHIFGDEPKKEVAKPAVVVAKPVDAKVLKTRNGVPVDAAMDAIFRQLRVSKVCYEPERSTFFVRFEGNKELGTWANTWQILDQLTFQHIPSNGTYFLEEIDNDDYTRVWPDVSKLYCAEDKAAK